MVNLEVKLRRFVNVDEQISTYLLSPFEKISVGFRIAWREQRFYQVSKQREENLEIKKRLERQEELKIETLQLLHKNIIIEGCKAITVRYDREDMDNVYDILQSRDFSGYNFDMEPVAEDLLYCYGNDLPIMITFRPRTIGEE